MRSGTLVEGFPDSTDPLAFSTATLFLPTRRACALAREAFLDELKSAVLPRIVPLGDIDEDELVFADATNETALELPPALPPLQRRLLLARLVMQWAAQLKPAAGEPALIVHSPASALALADDLARLIDDMTTRQVDWLRLDTLVPDHLDKYWQLTLDFLKIARAAWPAILEERGAIEPAARRDLLIEAERTRLAAHPGPVIAAGSTGSMPATAKLIAAIATLRHGAVVLPGLDTELDAAAWTLIGGTPEDPPVSGHPQLAMHALLRRIGIARDEVVRLGTGSARGRVVSEAMRPSAATERWAERIEAATRDTALADVSVIEAGNAEEEALAIAVALREAVHENKTAAMVTADRALARRVGAALGRWNILVERFRRRRLARHRSRRVRAARRRSRAGGTAAGQAARASQAYALPARRRGGRACARHRDARACDPARTAPAAGREGTGRRTGNVPRRDAASFRSAPRAQADRSRGHAGAGRRARRGARAAM